MGQFLTVGVAKSIFIKKYGRIEKETILENLKNEIDINLYNYIEDEKYIMLSMKKEIFETELAPLIEEVTKYISNDNTEKIELFKKASKEIKGKNEDEIMEYLSEEIVYDLHFCEGSPFYNNFIHYIYPDYGERIFCDLVELISDGKIVMEACGEIFSFIRHAIINGLKSKIKSAIVVTISG